MSIAEKLAVAVLRRPRTQVEDAIKKLCSLISMGMIGQNNQTVLGLNTGSKWAIISRDLKSHHDPPLPIRIGALSVR